MKHVAHVPGERREDSVWFVWFDSGIIQAACDTGQLHRDLKRMPDAELRYPSKLYHLWVNASGG